MIGPPSGRKGNCYDNAFAESFYGRFKIELLEGGAFPTLQDTRTEVFDFIEMYYNGTGHPAKAATFFHWKQKPA